MCVPIDWQQQLCGGALDSAPSRLSISLHLLDACVQQAVAVAAALGQQLLAADLHNVYAGSQSYEPQPESLRA